ncbi:sterol homeostasis protein [Coemansia sp. RSA 988]|nr:sterol homeostasis protein [Coemansia sp. RSA 988]
MSALPLLPLKHYIQTLICTLSASSVGSLKDIAEVVSCNRIGCECHVLGDTHYRVALPLMTILILTAVVLTFGPQTPRSPLMAKSPSTSGRSSPQQPDAVDSRPPPSNSRLVCIECAQPVSSLYTVYGASHIRLTQCEHCKSFADKYVEHDVIVMFIDMLLHKPQVYRHLLVNHLEFRQPFIEHNVGKLGILLILFNVYIDWFRLEEGGRLRGHSELLFGKQHSFSVQYLFILGVSCIDAAALLVGILAASVIHQRSIAQARRWAAISTALIISNFAKVLVILLVIWEYNESYYPWLLDLLQFTSQTTAISVLFDINALWAGLVITFSMAFKQLVHFAVLNIASLFF